MTKAVFVGVAASTLGVHLLGRDHLFNLVLSPQILQEGQVHRLLTHPWFFRTSAEALFGGVLLYQLRIIERRYGSHKFAVRDSAHRERTSLTDDARSPL